MPEDPHAAIAWFELDESYGRDAADNLEPIQEIGLSIPMPQMSPGGVVLSTAATRLKVTAAERLDEDTIVRIIPGTRLVETSSPFIANAIGGTGLFHPVDKPTKTRLDKARGETRAHIDACRERDAQVRAGHEPAPDATDTPAGGEQTS